MVRLQQLSVIRQQSVESVNELMNRILLLVIKAHKSLAFEEQERLEVNYFINGLTNTVVADFIDIANPHTSADAERLASSAIARHQERRPRESTVVRYFTENISMAASDFKPVLMTAVAGHQKQSFQCSERARRSVVGFSVGSNGEQDWLNGDFRLCYICGAERHIKRNCPKQSLSATG